MKSHKNCFELFQCVCMYPYIYVFFFWGFVQLIPTFVEKGRTKKPKDTAVHIWETYNWPLLSKRYIIKDPIYKDAARAVVCPKYGGVLIKFFMRIYIQRRWKFQSYLMEYKIKIFAKKFQKSIEVRLYDCDCIEFYGGTFNDYTLNVYESRSEIIAITSK